MNPGRNEEHAVIVSPLRPAYRVGHLVAAAAVAPTEDHERPPRAPRHGAVVARDATPGGDWDSMAHAYGR